MTTRYLTSFSLASLHQEASYFKDKYAIVHMTCYSDNAYPFDIFPDKGMELLEFSPITIFCGGNGCGKSTLLNVIAQKFQLLRRSPFNNTPFFTDYLRMCSYTLAPDISALPRGSAIITSDDVFDDILIERSINEGVDARRQEISDEYLRVRGEIRSAQGYRFQSMEDLDALKLRNSVRKKTRSAFINDRLPRNIAGHSNGENAFAFFTSEIRENALYLLDEPENSLSPARQLELAAFLEESARFYGCQFILSTHSPFLLAMRGARIYDMSQNPVQTCRWTELEHVRAYYDFFSAHGAEFQGTSE